MTVVGDWPISVLAAGPTVSSQLFGSFLIGLREGLEAAIVVTILVAFLVKSDRRDALKWVWLGVGAAIAMTVAVFLVIQFGENTISGLAAEAIAGIASLVAVLIVTTMVLWMKKASAGLSGELRGDMARALETGGLAVLDAGVPGRRPRGRRDRAVHGRVRRGVHHVAAARPGHRRPGGVR